MKLTLIKKAILLLMTVFAVGTTAQNPTYSCIMKNEVMVSPSVYQFEIYIYKTGSLSLFLNNYQLCFKIINASAIINGGTLSASYVAASSQLPMAIPNSTVNILELSGITYLKINGPPPSSCGDSIPVTGLRIGTFRVTNTVNYLQQPVLSCNNAVPATTLVYAIVPPALCGNVVAITDFSSHSVPNPPGTSITAVNVLCNGDATGSADLTLTGGIPPFSYLWSNGATSQDLSNVPAGTYLVTITDSIGSAYYGSVSISQPPPISVIFTIYNENCMNSCDGAVFAVVSGGTPDSNSDYNYLWNTAPPQITRDATLLCQGTYTLVVTDSVGCTASKTATVSTNWSITASATASPVSGVPPLAVNFTFTGSGAVSYSWDFGDGSAISTLKNPSHTFTQNGIFNVMLIVSSDTPYYCTDTAYITITAGAGLPDFNSDYNVSVSPNPASTVISCESGVMSKDALYKVYNVLGTVIISKPFTGKKFDVDVSGLAKGMYYLRVENESGVGVKRFVKE